MAATSSILFIDFDIKIKHLTASKGASLMLRVQRYTFFLNLQRFFAKKCFFLSVLAKKMLFGRILDGFFVEFKKK